MGCCQSLETDDHFDPRESDRLLGSNGSVESGNGQAASSVDGNGQKSKSDEQSAMQRILQDAASSIIDVTGSEVMPVVEEAENQNKNRQYTARLDRVHISVKPTMSLGRANPQTVLAAPGVPSSDLDLVTEAAEKTAHCMSKMQIHKKEELVVPFGVP